MNHCCPEKPITDNKPSQKGLILKVRLICVVFFIRTRCKQKRLLIGHPRRQSLLMQPWENGFNSGMLTLENKTLWWVSGHTSVSREPRKRKDQRWTVCGMTGQGGRAIERLFMCLEFVGLIINSPLFLFVTVARFHKRSGTYWQKYIKQPTTNKREITQKL